MYSNNEEKLSYARQCLQKKARDNSRTPMQWDSSPNSGFCDAGVNPWMRINDDWVDVNAEKQIQNPDETNLSVWQFWKKALSLRKEYKDTLVYGKFEVINMEDEDIFAYLRFTEHEKWVVILNYNNKIVKWHLPDQIKVKKWILGNYPKNVSALPLAGALTLNPWEGLWGLCN